jgi:hypothetical protein
MNKSLLFILPILALASLAPVWGVEQGAGINTRQYRQQVRIREGFCAGQLTWKEVRQLEKGELRIARLEAGLKADGNLTRRERSCLQRALDRQSRAIYRQRHDAQHRRAQ